MKTGYSRRRVMLAYAVAMATDALQICLGPMGFFFVDQFLDLIAAGVLSYLIGFHVLLLPTLVLEAIPVAGLMPTWTACTFLVLRLRERELRDPMTPNSWRG